eukprot:sb/3478357/
MKLPLPCQRTKVLEVLFRETPTSFTILSDVTGYQPIRDQYLDHVHGYQPIRARYLDQVTGYQPIRARYFGHVTGYQPIRTRYLGHWLSAKQGLVFHDSVGS